MILIFSPKKHTSTALPGFPWHSPFSDTATLWISSIPLDWGPADRISIPRGFEGNEGRKGLRMLFWCHDTPRYVFFFFWDSELEQFTWVCSCWIITWKRWRLTLWDLYEIDVMMFGMTLYWYDTRVYCYDLCCSPIYHLAPVREVVLTSFLQCLVKSPWWLSRKRLRRREKRPPQSRSFSDRDSPWIFHIFVHVYPFGYWVPISMETKQCPKSPVDELMSSGIIQYYTNQHIVTIITSVR